MARLARVRAHRCWPAKLRQRVLAGRDGEMRSSIRLSRSGWRDRTAGGWWWRNRYNHRLTCLVVAGRCRTSVLTPQLLLTGKPGRGTGRRARTGRRHLPVRGDWLRPPPPPAPGTCFCCPVDVLRAPPADSFLARTVSIGNLRDDDFHPISRRRVSRPIMRTRLREGF